MPGKDGTGPNEKGSMIGGGLGPCGRGMRRGVRRSLGKGRFASCPKKFTVGFSKDEEKKILEADLKDIEAEKETIKKRLKAMN